jgi:hypothetical protein
MHPLQQRGPCEKKLQNPSEVLLLNSERRKKDKKKKTDPSDPKTINDTEGVIDTIEIPLDP